jgi:hypothetical protein
MKWLCYLLSVWVMGQVALPCADALVGEGKPAHVHTAGAPEPEESHHDQCSPFCACTCCAAVVVADFFFPSFALLLVYPAKPASDVLAQFTARDISPCWHPPQACVFWV